MKLIIIFLIKLKFIYIKKAAIHIAVEKGNTEIISLLLNHQNVDVNERTILIFLIDYISKIFIFNYVKNSLILITFKN